MVVPIRELANIHFFISVTISQPSIIARIPSNMNMDINIDIIRKRSNSSRKVSSKESLTYSNASSTLYYKRMKIQNNFLDKDIQKYIKSSQLFYILIKE